MLFGSTIVLELMNGFCIIWIASAPVGVEGWAVVLFTVVMDAWWLVLFKKAWCGCTIVQTLNNLAKIAPVEFYADCFVGAVGVFRNVTNQCTPMTKIMSSVLLNIRLKPKPPKNAPMQFISRQRKVKKCMQANAKLLKTTAGIAPTVARKKLGNINRKENS